MTYTNRDASLTIGGVHLEYWESSDPFPRESVSSSSTNTSATYRTLRSHQDGVSDIKIKTSDGSSSSTTTYKTVKVKFIIDDTNKSLLSTTGSVAVTVDFGGITYTYSDVEISNSYLNYGKDLNGTLELTIKSNATIT